MIQQLSQDLLWSQIVAKAWCDGGLLQRLLADPRIVLTEHGIEVPENMKVKVREAAEVKVVDLPDNVRHFTFPLTPPGDLMDEDLLGGVMAGCFSAVCAACAACGACGRCACRCSCRCSCRCF
jgi:hypothetical protein